MSGSWYPRYSQADDDYLRAAWTADVPISEIAEHMGRTEAAVANRAAKLLLRRPGNERPLTNDRLTNKIWTHRTEEARAKLYAKAGRNYSPDNLRMRGAA